MPSGPNHNQPGFFDAANSELGGIRAYDSVPLSRQIWEALQPPSDSSVLTPAYVQNAVTEQFVVSSSPVTAAFGAPCAAGNAIIVIVFGGGVGTVTFTGITDSDGNSYAPCAGTSIASSVDAINGQMFVAFDTRFTGSINTVSSLFTGSTYNYALYAFEVSNVTGFDVGTAGVANGVQGSTAQATVITTALPTELVIAATYNSGMASGPGPGYTQIELTPLYGDELEYLVSGAAYTRFAPVAPLNDAQDWSIIGGAFYGRATGVGRVYAAGRTIGESIPSPVDSVSQTTGGGGTPYVRSISEVVASPSDSVIRSVAADRAISETVVAPSDAVARAVSSGRAISESVASPSDAIARSTAGRRSIVESVVSPTDAVSRSLALVRSVSESVTPPTDSVSRSFSGGRTMSEVVAAPTDAVVRSVAYGTNIAESIVAPTDSPARQTGAARSIGETVIAPSDIVVRALAQQRSVAETITSPTDAVTRSTTYARQTTEFVAAAIDSVTRSFIGVRVVTESIPAPSDAVSQASGTTRSVSEAIVLPSDTVSRSFAGVRIVAELIAGPSDVVSRQMSNARSIAEGVASPVDVVATQSTISRAMMESIVAPFDTVTSAFGYGRDIAEAIRAPSDAVDRAALLLRNIAESIVAPFDTVTSQIGPTPSPHPAVGQSKLHRPPRSASLGGGGAVKQALDDRTYAVRDLLRERKRQQEAREAERLRQDAFLREQIVDASEPDASSTGPAVVEEPDVEAAVVLPVGQHARVRAEIDGIVNYGPESTATITTDDGARYVYAGVDQANVGPGDGTHVEAGETIGRSVGATVERTIERPAEPQAQSTPTAASPASPESPPFEIVIGHTGTSVSLYPYPTAQAALPLPRPPASPPVQPLPPALGASPPAPDGAPTVKTAAVVAAGVLGAAIIYRLVRPPTAKARSKFSSSVPTSTSKAPKVARNPYPTAPNRSVRTRSLPSNVRRPSKHRKAEGAALVEYPAHASIQEKWIDCRKDDCQRCPHGPYLYAMWRDERTGKVMTKYLGKKE